VHVVAALLNLGEFVLMFVATTGVFEGVWAKGLLVLPSTAFVEASSEGLSAAPRVFVAPRFAGGVTVATIFTMN